MNARVRLIKDGAIAFIELCGTQRHNALDVETARAFLARCQEVDRDPSVRAVVLAGEGASFGVGGDLHALRKGGADTTREIIAPLHEAVALLTGMAVPVVAKLRGIVAGGSMSLALACDIAICAADTRFNFAYVNAGTTADLGGSWHLPRIVGLQKALQISLMSETMSAVQAHALGLVNKVVPDKELDTEVANAARRLANGPTNALGRMKRLVRQSMTHELHEHLALELATFLQSAATSDFREAVDAILEKRSPHFTGE